MMDEVECPLRRSGEGGSGRRGPPEQEPEEGGVGVVLHALQDAVRPRVALAHGYWMTDRQGGSHVFVAMVMKVVAEDCLSCRTW